MAYEHWMRTMTQQSKSPLPKFSMPPVTETVLGIEFHRLAKWHSPYSGLLWSRFRDKFPKLDVKPALASQLEVIGATNPQPEPQFILLAEPDIRCWFVDKDGRSLIQVQSNRFTYNWRKTSAGDLYPQYEDGIRPEFKSALQEFLKFLKDEDLGVVQVLQCEVSYFNHLEIGKGWQSAEDIKRVFACWSGGSNNEFLRTPENVSFDMNYRMAEDRGRLRVSLKPGVRNSDGVEVLQLALTARGKPEDSSIDSILSWMDLGREWVVRGFADLTTPSMHALWQRST
jgi:uncharacterized protein (TIGR04255 family)